MKKVVAIILARGGSKGIPHKNIINFCGRPLLAWTIEHCLHAGINEVYVSSDSDEILNIGKSCGALSIKRPEDISGDTATSESGWLHALEVIDKKIDWVLAPQATSPLRTSEDIKRGLALASSGQYDSIFSCSVAEDLLFWQITPEGILKSINYDYQNRGRRQNRPKQYIENGSFYGKVDIDRWKGLGGIIATRILHHPLGSFKYQKNPTVPEIGICFEILNHMAISRTGEVSICVRFDPKRLGVIGDATRTPLVDIWNGEKRKEMIRLHVEGRRDKIPLCSYCDYWGVSTGM